MSINGDVLIKLAGMTSLTLPPPPKDLSNTGAFGPSSLKYSINDTRAFGNYNPPAKDLFDRPLPPVSEASYDRLSSTLKSITKPNNNVSVSAYIPTWPERFARGVERGIHQAGNKIGVDKIISHVRNRFGTPNR